MEVEIYNALQIKDTKYFTNGNLNEILGFWRELVRFKLRVWYSKGSIPFGFLIESNGCRKEASAREFDSHTPKLLTYNGLAMNSKAILKHKTLNYEMD
jgi:hypothetical protein